MERKIIFSADEYYHVYNRGNDKREIFLDDADRERFLKLLYLTNGTKPIVMRDLPRGDAYGFERGESLVDIGAYCLMPNHFHLLLRAKSDRGVTLFLHKLCTSFSMYFNLKYKRTGKLFEGAFKAQHADDDQYLKYLFAYIHLNPAKLVEPKWRESGVVNQIRIKKFLEQYYHSSLADYLGASREIGKILNYSVFPDYFSNAKEIWEELCTWLEDTEALPLGY